MLSEPFSDINMRGGAGAIYHLRSSEQARSAERQ